MREAVHSLGNERDGGVQHWATILASDLALDRPRLAKQNHFINKHRSGRR